MFDNLQNISDFNKISLNFYLYIIYFNIIRLIYIYSFFRLAKYSLKQNKLFFRYFSVISNLFC